MPRCPTTFVSAPYNQFAGIEPLGDLWRLAKEGQTLRCLLTTHPLGWELRRLREDALTKSEVAKTSVAVLDLAEAWKAEAVGRGWRVE